MIRTVYGTFQGPFPGIDWDKPAGPNTVRVTLAPGVVVHVEDVVVKQLTEVEPDASR